MSTPHNSAKKEDIAKVVLMPGDPLRAKFIAETYLKDVKLVNSVRNMFAFTGTYNGKEASEVKSVIKNNSKDYDPNQSRKYNATEENFLGNNDIDAGFEEYLERIANVPEITSAAFSAVFKTPLDMTAENNDILSIPENKDYTDANDEAICVAVL